MIFLLIVPIFFIGIFIFSLLTARYSPFEREKRKLSEGIALYNQKEFEKAFVYFNDQIQKGEKSVTAFFFRGLCHRRKNNLNLALFDLTTALSYDNSIAEVYSERGKIYFSMGETGKAAQEFEKALFYSKQQQPEVLRYKAILLMENGRYFQAARYLHKAVELGDEEANLLLMTPPFHNSFGFSKDTQNP